MPCDLAPLRLLCVRQDPADGPGEQCAFARAEKEAGKNQDGQVCRHHVADATDQTKYGSGHRHATSAALIGKPSRDWARDHGGQRPDRHRQAGGDCIRSQPLVGIGRHDLDRHANRTEAEEAGRPEPPVRYFSVALDVSIGVAL
jgi:hypothetical protein